MTELLKTIKRRISKDAFNDIKYYIGLYGIECAYGRSKKLEKSNTTKIDDDYIKAWEEANNLRHAFIEIQNKIVEADEKYKLN